MMKEGLTNTEPARKLALICSPVKTAATTTVINGMITNAYEVPEAVQLFRTCK